MGRSLLKINNKIPNNVGSYNGSNIIKLKASEGEIIIDLDHFTLANTGIQSNINELPIGHYVGSQICKISSPNVTWDATYADIDYSNALTGIYEGKTVSFIDDWHTAQSSTFPQNLTDEPIVRNVTFTAVDGNTYNTNVTQAHYSSKNYEITLDGISDYGFVAAPSVMPNLDISTYDGVYASTNQKKSNTQAVARIDFHDMPKFTVWINSYAESNYDYTVASTLDAERYPTTYYDAFTKEHTQGYQKAIDTTATAPTDTIWKKVVYSNDGGNHFIYIVYRKDGSGDIGDDTGRFIVEVNG